MASQFHSGIDDLANESEISDLRNEVSKIHYTVRITQNEVEYTKSAIMIDIVASNAYL